MGLPKVTGERDLDDYEVQQKCFEMADTDITDRFDEPNAFEDWSPKPGGPRDDGFVQLRYAATCHRCKCASLIGSNRF